MSIIYEGDDFKTVMDKVVLSFERMRRIISDTGKTIEREALRNFRRTTNTWQRQPKFEAIAEYKDSGFEIIVGTDDVIYGYVDRGTRPHIIKPKGPWPLRFQSKYRAKTRPHILDSLSGGSSGDTVFAQEVYHPGTEAREFSNEIYKIVDTMAGDLVNKKIAAALSRR